MADQDEHHMESDLRSRTVALEQGIQALTPRVTALEKWQQQREIADATRDANWTAFTDKMDGRFNILETKINEQSGTLKWVNRMIIAAFIVGLIGLVFKSGFPLQ